MTLIILHGPGKGRVFHLDGQKPEVIGRQADRLKLNDTEASRRHAQVRHENDTWIIRDLGSTNGTFVNGRRLTGLTELEEGDQVVIGRATLVVAKLDDIAADAALVTDQPDSGAAQSPLDVLDSAPVSQGLQLGDEEEDEDEPTSDRPAVPSDEVWPDQSMPDEPVQSAQAPQEEGADLIALIEEDLAEAGVPMGGSPSPKPATDAGKEASSISLEDSAAPAVEADGREESDEVEESSESGASLQESLGAPFEEEGAQNEEVDERPEQEEAEPVAEERGGLPLDAVESLARQTTENDDDWEDELESLKPGESLEDSGVKPQEKVDPQDVSQQERDGIEATPEAAEPAHTSSLAPAVSDATSEFALTGDQDEDASKEINLDEVGEEPARQSVDWSALGVDAKEGDDAQPSDDARAQAIDANDSAVNAQPLRPDAVAGAVATTRVLSVDDEAHEVRAVNPTTTAQPSPTEDDQDHDPGSGGGGPRRRVAAVLLGLMILGCCVVGIWYVASNGYGQLPAQLQGWARVNAPSREHDANTVSQLAQRSTQRTESARRGRPSRGKETPPPNAASVNAIPRQHDNAADTPSTARTVASQANESTDGPTAMDRKFPTAKESSTLARVEPGESPTTSALAQGPRLLGAVVLADRVSRPTAELKPNADRSASESYEPDLSESSSEGADQAQPTSESRPSSSRTLPQGQREAPVETSPPPYGLDGRRDIDPRAFATAGERSEARAHLALADSGQDVAPGATSPGTKQRSDDAKMADGAHRRIAFLVDASGSVLDTLPQVVGWLDREIDKLKPTDRFTVIFFRRGQAIEVPPTGLRSPTTQVKHHVEQWIAPAQGNVLPSGRSDPVAALTLALTYQANQIVILSDDSISRRMTTRDVTHTFERIDQLVGDRDVHIHTVQFFYRDPKHVLQAMAKRYNGTYRFVDPDKNAPMPASPILLDQQLSQAR